MTPIRTSLLLTSLLVGLALPLAGAAPSFSEETDHLTLSNGSVTVTFQGKRPDLSVTTAQPADGDAALAYRFTKLVEYRDLDSDGAPDDNEVVATLDFAQGEWNATTNQTDDALQLTLSLEAPVQLAPAGGALPLNASGLPLPPQNARIALTFALSDAERVLQAGGVEATVAPTSLSHELAVASWPFVNADVDRLALVTLVSGDLTIEEVAGMERADVASNGTALGRLAWSPLAVGNSSEGETLDVPVRAVPIAGEGTTTLSFTYDAAGLASLSHQGLAGIDAPADILDESSSGPSSAVKDVPGPGLALAAAAAGLAAFARRRK